MSTRGSSWLKRPRPTPRRDAAAARAHAALDPDFGGLVALVALLVAARPRRAATVRRPRDVRERQLARCAERPPRPPTGPTRSRRARPSTPVRTWLPVAVVSSAAAAGVHAAAGPQHFAEGLLVGAFFVASALAQLGWAAAVLLYGPRRWLVWGALVGNLGVVGCGWSRRTVGIPGLGGAEPLGPWDLAATTWEVAVVAGVSLVLGSPRFRITTPGLDIVRWSVAARGWLLVSVALLAVLTVAGTSG